MKRALIAAAALIATALIPSPARAFVCIVGGCAGYCEKPVPFRLGTTSDDLGPEQSELELKQSFEAWTKPACTNLKVQYAGRTTDAPASGNGVVAWVESGWSGGSGTIGTTGIRGSGGCIRSFMRLNAVNFKWVSGKPASRGEVNAFSILTHEAGHYIGLGHSTAAGAIMAARYSGGVLSVTEDDVAGVCRIYAGSGGGVAPDRDGGSAPDVRAASPDGSARDTSSVRDTAPARDAAPSPRDGAPMPVTPPPPPAGAIDGSGCDTNDDCRSALCLDVEGRGVCSRLCASNTDCASGSSCRRMGAEGVCLPIASTPGSGGASGGASTPMGGSTPTGGSTPGGAAGAPGQDVGDKRQVAGGCTVGHRGEASLAPLALLLVALALVRRR